MSSPTTADPNTDDASSIEEKKDGSKRSKKAKKYRYGSSTFCLLSSFSDVDLNTVATSSTISSGDSKVAKVMIDMLDLKEMEHKRNLMLLYAGVTLIYLSIQIALFGLNWQDQDFIEANYYLPFHLLEFWAIFAFTVIEAFVLIQSGFLHVHGDWIQNVQIALVWFNVLFTCIVAIIFNM